MSDAVKGVVETSLNVGVVTMNEHEAEIVCLIRSLIDSGKDYVASMLTAIGELAGAKTSPSGGYPGWQPDPTSPVMALVRETYQNCSTKRLTSWLSMPVWNVVCSKNPILTWTWCRLGQP